MFHNWITTAGCRGHSGCQSTHHRTAWSSETDDSRSWILPEGANAVCYWWFFSCHVIDYQTFPSTGKCCYPACRCALDVFTAISKRSGTALSNFYPIWTAYLRFAYSSWWNSLILQSSSIRTGSCSVCFGWRLETDCRASQSCWRPCPSSRIRGRSTWLTLARYQLVAVVAAAFPSRP